MEEPAATEAPAEAPPAAAAAPPAKTPKRSADAPTEAAKRAATALFSAGKEKRERKPTEVRNGVGSPPPPPPPQQPAASPVPYEKERIANIARNQARLAAFMQPLAQTLADVHQPAPQTAHAGLAAARRGGGNGAGTGGGRRTRKPVG